MAVRFREIPPFGRDGVRKTRSNRSVSKKMTAHDYEATLQVRMHSFKWFYIDSLCRNSAQYPSSIIFSRNPTTCMLWNSCLI
jgi:hypothetical protein